MEKELNTPSFRAAFRLLDTMIDNIHPNIEVRKVYALLRIKGLSPKEINEIFDNVIQKKLTPRK